MRLSCTTLLMLLGFAFCTSSQTNAQIAAAVGPAYTDLGDVSRWGVNGGFLIPVANNSFDIVPNFEYYYAKWSVDSSLPQRDIYVVAVDAHANLPELASRLRPYIGTGVAFAGHGDENAFGVNLAAGAYVRAIGWKIFPFAHVSYRILPDFEEIETLDAYFFRGGVRIAL